MTKGTLPRPPSQSRRGAARRVQLRSQGKHRLSNHHRPPLTGPERVYYHSHALRTECSRGRRGVPASRPVPPSHRVLRLTVLVTDLKTHPAYARCWGR